MQKINRVKQICHSLGLLTLIPLLFIANNSLSQTTSSDNEWWKPIAQTHHINYDGYTLHENYFIAGPKTIIGITETYKDVTIIANNRNEYIIFESQNAIYNMKLNTLYINNSAMHQIRKDSNANDSMQSHFYVNYSINFNDNIATIMDLNPIE